MQARVVLVAFGFIQSFLCTGIVYGWPGLVLILKGEGLYSEKCPVGGAVPVSAQFAGNASNALRSEGSCTGQQAALNALFTIAQGCLTAAMLVNGVLVDTMGPRMASVAGTCLVVTGALLFALFKSVNICDCEVRGCAVEGRTASREARSAAFHEAYYTIQA